MYFYLPTRFTHSVNGESADHLFSMRVKIGDTLTTSDFCGTKRIVKVNAVDKKIRTIIFTVLREEKKDLSPAKNVLFQALPDKLYLEKLVEILPHADIDTVYLFESEYSPVGTFSLERLEKILIRSCEQSQKLFKPKIQFVSFEEIKKVLETYSPIVLDGSLGSQYIPVTDHTSTKSILVGPEGGWSKAEKDLFKDKKLRIESLGSIVYPAWLAGYTWFIKQHTN